MVVVGVHLNDSAGERVADLIAGFVGHSDAVAEGR